MIHHQDANRLCGSSFRGSGNMYRILQVEVEALVASRRERPRSGRVNQGEVGVAGSSGCGLLAGGHKVVWSV